MSVDLAYDRHVDFYRDVNRTHIRSDRTVFGIDLLNVAQPAGDFSDAPSNDLTIQRTLCRARFHADYGAGRFSEWSHMRAFLLAPPRTAAAIIIDTDHHLDMISINWNRLLVADIEGRLPRNGDFGGIHSSVVTDPSMDRLIERLWEADPAAGTLDQDILISALIDRLAAWTRDGAARPTKTRERLSPAALRRAIAMMEDNEADDLSLADLASVAGLSPHHFCRAFRATTGLPPHRYRIASRMMRARSLLSEPQRTIGDVAAAVGYLDPAYFSRLFRRETGFSPRQWQQEWN